MRTPDTHIMFQPRHYTRTDYSITAHPGDPYEIENLRNIVEGGDCSPGTQEQKAIQDTGLGDNRVYRVTFELPNSDDQVKIEKQLQNMGHQPENNLPINPPLRHSY